MNPLLAAALEIQAFCRAQPWRFCFIGGPAVQRWGEPRLTQDAESPEDAQRLRAILDRARP